MPGNLIAVLFLKKYMSTHLTLEFLAELPELERINAAIDQFSQAHGWSPESLFHVQLVLEEVVANVISYGSGGHSLPRVSIKLIQEGPILSIEVSDDGVPFDPFQNADPDLNFSLDDRAIGGLGVYLVRQLMDSVSYQRDREKNILSITKKLQ
jgi:serine/threonine-protein kinase RsbW